MKGTLLALCALAALVLVAGQLGTHQEYRKDDSWRPLEEREHGEGKWDRFDLTYEEQPPKEKPKPEAPRKEPEKPHKAPKKEAPPPKEKPKPKEKPEAKKEEPKKKPAEESPNDKTMTKLAEQGGGKVVLAQAALQRLGIPSPKIDYEAQSEMERNAMKDVQAKIKGINDEVKNTVADLKKSLEESLEGIPKDRLPEETDAKKLAEEKLKEALSESPVAPDVMELKKQFQNTPMPVADGGEQVQSAIGVR
mmetsp:Transcript_22518/g.72484  ORF Transcript_22518/g.72484 Transcript_22518/m.72484 type:complete len:250 (+) Transcript_22518:2-751(+)|eukprot:CAMPEP_0196782078 /NCGR_PEP_ID=MMETSP1104-20130614/10645_1 /TAXON_ID=33652 /ORGANISM="Cafeteria sp., Strain Caron Lab Isolate" /LENGTH=249 /DNA_ID=CAMNT_0042152309 /DNA_START=1 /DNA_END=750 /DNA_ORIENTATION=+